jgi:hypothetical protein
MPRKPPISELVTVARKRHLADLLHVAWARYVDLLGEPPHGTLLQIRALVELMKIDDFIDGIRQSESDHAS